MYGPGPLKLGDLTNILPMEGMLVVLKITGAQARACTADGFPAGHCGKGEMCAWGGGVSVMCFYLLGRLAWLEEAKRWMVGCTFPS